MERIDNLDLDQLRALHAAAKITRLIPNGAAFTDDGKHCGRFFETQRISFALASRRAEYFAAIHNAFPAIADRLEAAERERDELRGAREAETNHWVSVIRSLDKENLCDFFDGIGAEEGLRDWLAARDARQRALGAAVALERMANEECSTVFPGDLPHVTNNDLLEEAARLRREAGE